MTAEELTRHCKDIDWKIQHVEQFLATSVRSERRGTALEVKLTTVTVPPIQLNHDHPSSAAMAFVRV